MAEQRSSASLERDTATAGIILVAAWHALARSRRSGGNHPRSSGSRIDHRSVLVATLARVPTTAEELAVSTAWRASPVAAKRALEAVKGTRDALATVLTALLSSGADPIEPELEHLSLGWAAAAARSKLMIGSREQVGAQWSVGCSPRLLIPDRVAYAAVELLCEVDLSRLGMCPTEDGGCGWLFIDRIIDRSRNGSRRWCTMDDCGTQVKMRRLTERRRSLQLLRVDSSHSADKVPNS